MTTNPAVIIPFSIGIFGPLFALVVMRPRPATTRATVALGAEVFVGVNVAVLLTRFAVMPALHWLNLQLR